MLDMTMMYALHDALRRDLHRLARATCRPDDDPAAVLRSAVGWELFKTYLGVHHRAEDDALWPAARAAVAGKPEDLALLDAMEAEHAVIDPALAAIDAALADRDSGPARLGGLVDDLAAKLTAHLTHEERAALPLIDATVPEPDWRRFGQLHSRRVGDDARRYLPWVVDALPPDRLATILDRMPPPIREAYYDDWSPAYRALRPWPASVGEAQAGVEAGERGR